MDRARALVRTGEWARVRPGAFVEVASLDADPYVRERQVLLGRIVAVVAQSGPTTVVSHASAAAAWGLPLDRLPHRVEVLKPVRRAGNAASDVVRRVRSAHDLDAEQFRGLPVTSMTRTVVDCALTLGGRGGLVVADAALAAGVSRTACQALLARSSGARGIRAAREVVACADAGAESAGETRARWTVLVAGLPAPTTQLAVETHLGVFWADLGWPQWRLLIEYDGVAKYGNDAAAAVLAERRRQLAIEEAGWRVVRVTAADLRDREALPRRVLRLIPRDAAGAVTPRLALDARASPWAHPEVDRLRRRR